MRMGLPLLALLVAAPGGRLAAVELDLERAVETALQKNPALLAVEELRSQVRGGIVEARANALPQVAAVADWGQSRSPALLNSPDFAEFVEQFPGGDFEPATQELTRTLVEVSQPIFTFGKVGAAIDLARLVADAAEAQILTARLDTGLLAAEAYYDVLSAREGLSTTQSEREFRRRDLERVASLLEIGEATELERLRAAAALAEVEPEVARRQGEVAVAETRLRWALALPAGEPLELVPAGRDLPEPAGYAELVEEAFAERPELRDLELQSQVYEKRQKVTRADGLPQIDFDGSYGREVRLVENFSDSLYSAWSFGVGLRWEFFDGGRRRGQIAQLESQRQQLAWQRADLQARIRLEIEQALSDYRTERARAAAAGSSAQAAGEALRVARELYEEGVATQTELLDAQSRATAADVLAVEAFYDALIEASRLARALGRLPTASWTTLAEK
jgi:HAE1 family hydrophobic/amphiphilic exporter-1